MLLIQLNGIKQPGDTLFQGWGHFLENPYF